ncbi:SPOR domain-containing protein [Methylovorus mays]|uniref:SPOR domain-containing protein n=1 Tax=Methylovorus mays TaxID=184077 RepID=UPI001E50C534|nr:SPOR domain-containing protein [Methylovorus mays]MCB5207606.1 SPOR domain-containing protein [Methylovorus mays]
MKWLVSALVLTNILVWAYFETQPSGNGSSATAEQSISPERIKIYTAEEAARLPRKEIAAAESVTNACYEWAGFTANTVATARAALLKLSISPQEREDVVSGVIRYWVYIPPLKSLQAAQAKIVELQALGVSESAVMQDPLWRNAISLGVFTDEQLANRLLADLRSRGIRSAIKGMRRAEKGLTTLVLGPLSPEVVTEVEQLKPEFAGTEFKQVNCQ